MIDEKATVGVYLKGYLGALAMLCASDDAKVFAKDLNGGLSVKVCGSLATFLFDGQTLSCSDERTVSHKVVFKELTDFIDFLVGKPSKYRVSGGAKARKKVDALSRLAVLLNNKCGFLNNAEQADVSHVIRCGVYSNSIAVLPEYDRIAKLTVKGLDDGCFSVSSDDEKFSVFFYAEDGALKCYQSANGIVKAGVKFSYLSDAEAFLCGRCDLTDCILKGTATVSGAILNVDGLKRLAVRAAKFYGGVL